MGEFPENEPASSPVPTTHSGKPWISTGIGTFLDLSSEDTSGSAENGVLQVNPRTVGHSDRLGKVRNDETPPISDVSESCNEHSSIPSPIGTTVTEFERCRQGLQHAVKHCLDVDFLYVSSAISCILNSLRPLRAWEVDTAVSLLAGYADTERRAFDGHELPEGGWLQRCTSFLVIDDAGLVRFASNFMPYFLKQFRIRGVDVSHQTIATACLIQVEIDERSETASSVESSTSLTAESRLAFSGYASKYWLEHCRCVEQSCQALDATNDAGPDPSRSMVCQGSAVDAAAQADADLDTIGMEHLMLGDDDMDWVMIDGTS